MRVPFLNAHRFPLGMGENHAHGSSSEPLFVVPRRDNGTLVFERARFVPDARSPEALSSEEVERFWKDWSIDRYIERLGEEVVPQRVYEETLRGRSVYLARGLYDQVMPDAVQKRTNLVTGAHAVMDLLRRKVFEIARHHDASAYGLEVGVSEIDVPSEILEASFVKGPVHGYELKPIAYLLY